jgi:hypothetical protein
MAKKRNHNGGNDGQAAKPAEATAAYFLSLTVRNVRCFGDEPQTLNLSDQEGRPARLTALIGNNGTGKTTLLQALAFFEDPADELSGFLSHRVPRFLRTGAKEGKTAATIVLGPGLHSLDGSSATVELSCVETPMGYHLDGNPRRTVPLRRYGYGSSRRFSLKGLPEGVPDDPTDTLFSDDANLRNAEDWLLTLDYTSFRPSPIRERQKGLRNVVTRLLIDILPDVDDIRFDAGEGIYPKPKVEAKTPYGWVPLRQLGHGYRTLIAWVVDFVSRLAERRPDSPNPLDAPAVVLVDEIDLHMHPEWQRKVMKKLTESFPNTQFIVTAHSPLIVQAAAEDANIALLRREGDHVVIDNDMDYIRGWDVDMLLVSDLFGLPSARPPQYDAIFERREKLLGKSKLTSKEKQELAELNEKVFQLPFGETADQAKTMDLIQKTLKRLEERERQAQ